MSLKKEEKAQVFKPDFENRWALQWCNSTFITAGKFWHITDLHWDPTYDPNNQPEQVCASSEQRPADNAGEFGDYVCDAPWTLINSTLYAMKDILPEPDFIVWTGYVDLSALLG